MSLNYNDDSAFSGSVAVYGGSGLECGGAGILLRRDKDDNIRKLFVDNENVCSPLDPTIDWSVLTGTHTGRLSHHTWLLNEPDSREHVFDVRKNILFLFYPFP